MNLNLQETAKNLIQLAGRLRTDNWQNVLTGFGTNRDRTQAGTYTPDALIPDVQLSAMYHGEGITRRVVNIVPREMLRQGFKITCAQDPPAAAIIGRRVKGLNVLRYVRDGFIWGRLFGGAATLIGAVDGRTPDQPLDEANITEIAFLHGYDRRQIQPVRWQEDPKGANYNCPITYRLTNLRTGGVSVVHESRLILYGGAHTGEMEKIQNLGWDHSIIQAIFPIIRQFDANYKAVELMMTDASQSVFTLKGLLAMIAGGQLEDLRTRALFLDQMRSMTRSIFLDEGEKYEKQVTSFGGVADILDRTANRLAADVEIPVTFLMGQAPAGLGATGASDTRSFYDRTKADQETELKPRLERLIRLIAISENLGDRRFEISFPPLWQETPLEKATRNKMETDEAAVLISSEILTPDAVAIARYGAEEPQPYRVNPAERMAQPNLDTPPAPPPPAPAPPPGVPKPQG